MKTLLLATTLAVAAVPAFATTYAIQNVGLSPGSLATAFPTTTITIDPAAIRNGHFKVQAHGGPSTLTGDVDEFISFRSGGITIDKSGTAPYYSLLIDLSFDSNGEIKAAHLNYAGISPTIELLGDGTSMTGLYTPTDNFVCGTTADCRVLRARIVEVGEPNALSTVLVGLSALLVASFVRWRRKAALLTAV